MSWINSRQFTISNRNGRHYVFRRNNAGNTEINIPTHIVSKGQAIAWLKSHPNKVAKPTRYRAKRTTRAPPPSGKKPGVPYKYIPPPPPKPPPGGWRYPAPKIHPYKKMANIPVKNVWAVTCDQLKSALKSSSPLGKGRQGIVFEALRNGRKFAVKVAPRDLAAKKRGETQPVDIEFKIQDAVQILSPNVVRVYKNMRCTDFITPAQIDMANVQNTSRYNKSQQGIILMEFANGGSLDSWLKKKAKVDDEIMAHIISDILGALYNIQKRFPNFRHNDLHMQNVFVADRGFLIGDFGWARLEKSGTNPAVNTANGTQTASFWGVGPKTDVRYDQHLFLNELLNWAMDHSPTAHPKAIEFLKRAVPMGYRGAKNTHISEWRLKYEDPCIGLPSLEKLLKDPFLRGVKSPKVTSANLLLAKAKLKPVRLVTSLYLKKAKAKLKAVARPKSKPRITSYNLRAAKAKLRKPKVPSPLKKKMLRLPSPLSPLSPRKPKVPSPLKRPNYRLSPSSGRAKIQSKNSGRWVYANLHYSMDELKALAARLNVSIKGLRSKANIAKKLFG